MRKLDLLLVFVLISVLFAGCLKKEDGDKEKNVVMTIYPETGYGASLMSNIITQPLIFTDSDDNQKQMLVDIITEGFSFDYERGYEYTLKVKKVWMHEPPQDVSSIKYVFIELLSKKKMITEDSEKEMELLVSPKTVKFTPKFPSEYDEDGIIKVYDALYVKENGTIDWMALLAIEGFNYEEGYEYLLNVKKITTAEPYSVKYVLLNILSKNQKI
jgi:hypothetical protein